MTPTTRLSLVIALTAATFYGCATDDKPGGDAGPAVDAGADAAVPVDMGAIDQGPPDLGPADLGPPDMGPGVTLAGAGNKWGECIGNCRYAISIAAPSLTLTIGNYFGTMVNITNDGSLTSAGLSRLAAVESDLAMRTLQSTYGCPDCADGGASWLEVRSMVGALSEHTYEYGNPPTDTLLANALVQDIISALTTCTPTADVRIDSGCTPL